MFFFCVHLSILQRAPAASTKYYEKYKFGTLKWYILLLYWDNVQIFELISYNIGFWLILGCDHGFFLWSSLGYMLANQNQQNWYLSCNRQKKFISNVIYLGRFSISNHAFTIKILMVGYILRIDRATAELIIHLRDGC